MSELIGEAGPKALDAIAEREALAPAPRLIDTVAAVIFARTTTIVAAVIILLFIAVAVFAPLIAPYDPLRQSLL